MCADKSKIEWTDATWSPIRARNKATGKVGFYCEHATTGCEFCYAERMNLRLGTGLPFKPGHRKDVDLFLDEKMLTAPLRWKRPRMIFVCSMTDLFADFVPDAWIDRVFAVMALAPQHMFQVLTKRAKRMREWACDERTKLRVQAAVGTLSPDSETEWHWPLPNVWKGVSAERQQEADERIPHLLATPGAVRFVSAEPLLGPVDFGPRNDYELSPLIGFDHAGGSEPRLDWIIAGGESGPGARPMHPDWARSIRDQCAAASVPFFFKQWGEWVPFATTAFYDSETIGGNCGGPGQISYAGDGATWNRPKVCFGPDEWVRAEVREVKDHSWGKDDKLRMTYCRVGKRRAGRLLDGVTHDGIPR